MTDKIEIFDIWAPVEKGGEAVTADGKNLKLIAKITSSGKIIYLAEKSVLEKVTLSNEEFKHYYDKN